MDVKVTLMVSKQDLSTSLQGTLCMGKARLPIAGNMHLGQDLSQSSFAQME